MSGGHDLAAAPPASGPDPGDGPQVAIVTINWFGGADTVACLRSLVGLEHRDWMVIVVDNGSTDGSPERIWAEMQSLAGPDGLPCQRLDRQQVRQAQQDGGGGAVPRPARFTLIDAGANLGFAAGNNLGMAWALCVGARHLWILNNDVEVAPGALGALLERLHRGPASVAGSVLVYHDQPRTLQCIGGARFNRLLARGEQVGEGRDWDGLSPLPEPADLAYVAGASMLVSARTVREVGMMEERYFLYFEEIDWMQRLGRAGPPVVATTSIVRHKEGASIGTASRAIRSLKSQYYLSRNLVLFYRWCLPLLLPMALLRNLREAQLLRAAGHAGHARTVLKATVDGVLGRCGPVSGV